MPTEAVAFQAEDAPTATTPEPHANNGMQLTQNNGRGGEGGWNSGNPLFIFVTSMVLQLDREVPLWQDQISAVSCL